MNNDRKRQIEKRLESLHREWLELLAKSMCNGPEINEYAGNTYGSELAGIDYTPYEEAQAVIDANMKKNVEDQNLLKSLLANEIDFQEGKIDDLQLQVTTLNRQISELESTKTGLETQMAQLQRIAELLK